MATRPAPGAKKQPPKKNAFVKAQEQSIGKPDQGSRLKADAAAARVDATASTEVPLTLDGRPLVMIEMSAAELIPTGQYANVSIGPAKIRMWIDPQNDTPIADAEKENIIQAVNTLAEMVEIEILGVQRGIVLESLHNSNSAE